MNDLSFKLLLHLLKYSFRLLFVENQNSYAVQSGSFRYGWRAGTK